MHVERRRILLMRHGAVEYFDANGRPHPPDDVPLTAQGVEQAGSARRPRRASGGGPMAREAAGGHHGGRR